MLQTPFTSLLEDDDGGNQRRFFPCLLPFPFCGHGFIFENKHKTDEDFVLLCKRTSSTRRQRSANAVKAKCMHCERSESVLRAQIISRKNSVRPRCLGRCQDAVTGPFHEKYQGFLAISRRSAKLNNSETRQWKLGVTWALHVVKRLPTDLAVASSSLARGEIFSTVNGVPLHTAFHYQPLIVLIRLKYC